MKTFSATIALLCTLAPAAMSNQVHRGGHIRGYYTPTIIEGRTRADADVINVEGPEGREAITVTCAPFDWESYGPNPANFVDSIARAWCF